MRLSVVIPIYCVEQTLERCVESVLAQGIADMELILVDDGSTDNSGNICDQLSSGNKQISVIHKENGGLGDARNAGIEKATGSYITFVDSDDVLAPNTLAPLLKMLAEHPEYDILEYDTLIHYFTEDQSAIGLQDCIYGESADYWCGGKAYRHSYACNKVFRRELLNNHTFPKGRAFEDIWALKEILKSPHTIATTQKGFYCYYDNPQGITHKADGPSLMSLLEAHIEVLEQAILITRKGFSEYYMHVLNIQLDVYRLTGKVLLPDYSDQLRIRQIKSSGDKLKAIMLKTTGIKKLCKIHKIFKFSH
ncbi:MAG: glycosyltransferase [Prevotella sp.]|nr:glycosyltransferase [Prevotella sp.]